MRTAGDIYQQYKIMPNLQLHQLRVAAVGKIVCDNFNPPAGTHINAQDIVLACLFHDMGNILKFDLTVFPEALEPEGLAYWESVKKEFEEKYGKEQHSASKAIGREIGLPQSVLDIIESIRFSNLEEILAEPSFERKITEYSDCRVAPYGITSVRERFLDGRKRYIRHFPNAAENDEHYNALTRAGYEIEKRIFQHMPLSPEDINDESAAPHIEALRSYPVGR